MAAKKKKIVKPKAEITIKTKGKKVIKAQGKGKTKKTSSDSLNAAWISAQAQE